MLMLLVEITNVENKEIFNILQNNLNELLNNVSEKEIQEVKKHIRDNTKKYEICSITTIKDKNNEFRIEECFDTYITSVENKVCKRIKDIFIKQIALYQLSCEGEFMPIGYGCPLPELQFDIIHSGGNTIVYIKLNFLTLYNTYLKIV